MLPRPRSLASGGDGKPPTWGERLQALTYVPPLLKLVYETHRGYTVAILVLRAIRSFVPLAVLWIGKLIIDGVIAAVRVRAGGGGVDWWYLIGLVGLELGIAVVGEGLARLSSLLESLLGDLFSHRGCCCSSSWRCSRRASARRTMRLSAIRCCSSGPPSGGCSTACAMRARRTRWRRRSSCSTCRTSWWGGTQSCPTSSTRRTSASRSSATSSRRCSSRSVRSATTAPTL